MIIFHLNLFVHLLVKHTPKGVTEFNNKQMSTHRTDLLCFYDYLFLHISIDLPIAYSSVILFDILLHAFSIVIFRLHLHTSLH